jgi:hypothetical protein
MRSTAQPEENKMFTTTCEIDSNGTQRTWTYETEAKQERHVSSLLHQGFVILDFTKP